MRLSIQNYSEMKSGLTKAAVEIAKETFKENVIVARLMQKATFRSEYNRVTDLIVQKLIDKGLVKDMLELSSLFWEPKIAKIKN